MDGNNISLTSEGMDLKKKCIEICEQIAEAYSDEDDETFGLGGVRAANEIINRIRDLPMGEGVLNWRPISEYQDFRSVICSNVDKRWIRFGRQFPNNGSRWYYSATNERIQFGQIEGDDPTHFIPMLALPKE